MFHEDMYTVSRRMDMRVQAELREAEGRRLARLARGDREQARAPRGRPLWDGLVGLATAAGGRLKQYARPQAFWLGGQTSESR